MKNVLIMGGSTDIGISLAKYLISLGLNTIVTYHSHPIDDIPAIKCDIRNELEIEDAIKYVTDKYGKIDILINMAAISRDGEISSLEKKDFMDVLEVNLVGTFLAAKTYAKYQSNGMIINIGSTDGVDTYSPYSIFYSASKAGIINMSKSISLATENKVLCICPNWIDSASTRGMDKHYLDNELKRIHQERLITTSEFSKSVYKIINMNTDSGSVFRIDIKDCELWIEKI